MSDVEMGGPSGSSRPKLVYDPDQDPEEKRAVRKDYRNLTRKFEEHKTNPNEFSADQLADQVRKADQLFDRVKGPQEATLDSAFLLMASNLGAQKARALKSGSGAFDVDEFVSKLARFMGGRSLGANLPDETDDEPDEETKAEPLEWAKIGRRALGKSRRVPAIGFMLGPLSIEQKQRAPVKRAKLEKNKDDVRKPQELKEEDIARSENETTKNVAQIEQILSRIGEDKINIFKFVINPNDFAQSVENIFYLSFLIRDGKVAFETDEEDGEPFIWACEEPSDSDYLGGLKKRQMVLEFDKATWKRAIEVFDIKESVIPQRPPAKTRLGDKWYG